MRFKKLKKRTNILLIAIIFIFIILFTIVIYFSFRVKPFILFETLTKNKSLLILLFFILIIMFFLVIYHLVQIIIDRSKNREGARFRFRLTLFFLIITLIPIVPFFIISNNLISKSINLWFMTGIENSLEDAVKVSKELYSHLSMESREEWENICKGCSIKDVKERNLKFNKLDGIVVIDSYSQKLGNMYLQNKNIEKDIEYLKIDDIDLKNWKRVKIQDDEYLLTPINLDKDDKLILIRRVDQSIKNYTMEISSGLQNYRTQKIIRGPIKVVIILFYTLVTMPFLLLSFYLSLIISKDVTTPIKELAIATQKISNDDLDYKVVTTAKDELKLLVDSFNKMTEDLRINKELLKHSERSAAWSEIAKRIAHEIKNPLTPIKLSAERLFKLYKRDDHYKEVLLKAVNTIISEVNNIDKMVKEFSRFAKFPDLKLKKHDIIGIIDDIIDFLKDNYKSISFSFYHKEDHVYLLIDKEQIRRAILNIVYNSINAVSESGKIWLEGFINKDRKEYYIISINDNGIGIPDDIKDKIFDPYFSHNEKSSGLGLAIVEKTILDNKGRIWFQSKPGKTTFYLEFATV